MPVSDIYTLADDALQNLFEASFTDDGNVSEFAGDIDLINMKLRVTEFTKPDAGFDTYEVHYKTLKIVKPSGKTAFANEFSFTMRIDRDYAWYKFFENWNRAILSTKTGELALDSDESNYRANIKISPDGLGSEGWEFYQCFPKTIPSISFTQDSGEPVTCEITFGCNRMSTLERE